MHTNLDLANCSLNRLFFVMPNYFLSGLHWVWLFYCFHNNSGKFVNIACFCAKC